MLVEERWSARRRASSTALQKTSLICLIRCKTQMLSVWLKLPYDGYDFSLCNATGDFGYFHHKQCQIKLLFDSDYFGSPYAITDTFTEDHRNLAEAYWDVFRDSFYALSGLTLTDHYHLFTRIIYEYLLHDFHLPFTSTLSPHHAYSHPKAGMCAYRRPINDDEGYLDIQIDDITYVLDYYGGTCP